MAINVRYRVADTKKHRQIPKANRETDTYITDRDTFKPEVLSETDTYITCIDTIMEIKRYRYRAVDCR